MKEQEKKLAESLRPNRFVHRLPENPFRLMKQEIFGTTTNMKLVQFEWPPEKIFELMQDKDDLSIKSLTFQANEEKELISVQCTLTNGMRSPVYKSLMSDTPEDKIITSTVELPSE